MEPSRTRVCICYLISTLLITFFIYILVSSNLENNRKLSRLREDVDEIAHVVLHTVPGQGDTKHLNEIVDGILKKRLAGIWDDLYAMKKQLRLSECMGRSTGSAQSTAEGGEGALMERSMPARVNYAAEELGAKVLDVKAEPIDGGNVVRTALGLKYSANPPINMLKPGMEPGNCFAFKRVNAVVTIKLAQAIYVESFELEHLCKGNAPNNDTTSAPKDFEVYGIMATSWKEFKMGEYTYTNQQPLTQNFAVKCENKYLYMRFKFKSNHGHLEYTCVYRVAVYGRSQK
ncbi:SUN domain-containing protein 3 [Anastrepha obliqua]|uniref:SUN domain-containing protein 3 n=1 Tax=Anastrepha ludens TaxID=28586 RepID=UPI0023B154E3|nr:SUN domain-containing protein 3 [Anastrepha ludens]XP_054743618.1 SUN domain-containing protein 3 [Anastrepha obliqua]